MEIKKLKCDNCQKEWIDKSPPIDDAYENSVIKIVEGTMLIPRHLSESGTHSRYVGISGDYCSPKCLKEKIDSILKPTM